MTYFKFFIPLLFCVLACQSEKPNLEQQEEQEYSNNKPMRFPEDIIGSYKGNLEIFTSKGKTQDVDMNLTIGDLNQEGYYPWILQYGDQDSRNYGLFKKDSLDNEYYVDEFNGIILDSYWMGSQFVSHFSVAESEITSIYHFNDETVDFQIISTINDTIRKSQAVDGTAVFKVGSFPVAAYQRAKLNKVN